MAKVFNTGAAGPQGPIGPQGPQGPTGPAGSYSAGAGISITGSTLSVDTETVADTEYTATEITNLWNSISV